MVLAMESRARALRLRAGLTQAELVKASGLGADVISRLDSGGSQGRSSRVRKALARALKVPVKLIGHYLDGALPLDAVIPPPPLEAAIAFYPHRWGASTIAAARALQPHVTDHSPAMWAALMDQMERALQGVLRITLGDAGLQHMGDLDAERET